MSAISRIQSLTKGLEAPDSQIPGFSSVGAPNWLQGRRLIPIMNGYAAEIRGTVLDLGCGRSPFRPLFANAERYVRVDCYAVDEEVVVSDAANLPIEDGSIECILLAQVIGDVPDLINLFRELHRVLTPGGRILVYETITYPQHDLPNDCWRVLPSGLRWMAEEARLKVVQIELLGGYFTQLAMHLNIFIVGPLDRYAVTTPVAWIGRCGCNLVCRALDGLLPRPTLATDYFACLVKPHAAKEQDRP
jgi:SAM-dependent methyltransferase